MADNDPTSLSAAVSHLQLAGDTAATVSFSAPSPAQLHLEAPATTSTPSVDAPLAATDRDHPWSAPASAGSPSQSEEDDFDFDCDFSVTPLKDDCNQFAYYPPTDKQRGPFLIGKSAMGPRFCEYSIDKFMKRVPGDAPTAEERKKFEQVDCSKAKVEKDWYPLLVRVVFPQDCGLVLI